jgi:hypothetical protein
MGVDMTNRFSWRKRGEWAIQTESVKKDSNHPHPKKMPYEPIQNILLVKAAFLQIYRP